MNIFLSWSGERSKQVAEALRGWLVDVCQSLSPWMSSEDIHKGKTWRADIAQKLSDVNFGIICLTPENLNAPWLLFEAGALSKSFDESHVCTYLLGLKPSELKDPLAQFQATVAEKEDTFKLLKTINSSLGEKALDSNRLERAFDKFWPDFDKELQKIASSVATKPSIRPPGDMLDELINLTRGISADLRFSNKGMAFTMEAAIQSCLHGVSLLQADIQPRRIQRGGTLIIRYEIESQFEIPFGLWLGSSFRDKNGKLYHNVKQDKLIFLKSGIQQYSRDLTIENDAPVGDHEVGANLWFGVAGDSTQSKMLHSIKPITVTIV